MFRITVFSSTDLVALCAYKRDVTIQCYTNPKPNHKKGTNFRPRIHNPDNIAANRRKRRLFAAFGIKIRNS